MTKVNNVKNITVNAHAYETTGIFPVIVDDERVVPPLFEDYDRQRIYHPTPVERQEGLSLALTGSQQFKQLDGDFDPCLHMQETINCLHEGDELIQLVATNAVTGEKKVATIVEAGGILPEVLELNRKGWDIYLNLNPLVSDEGLKPNNLGFTVPCEENREATDKDVSNIGYFMIEVAPIELDGDDAECMVDAHFERVEAEATAWSVLRYLKEEMGLKSCFMAYDGKSYHLIWKTALQANDENMALLEKCQLALASGFNSDCTRINIDRCKPLEMIRLYGTLNFQTKGTENHPVSESHIVHAPVSVGFVTKDDIEDLAIHAPYDWNAEEYHRIEALDRTPNSLAYKNDKYEVVAVLGEVLSNAERYWCEEDKSFGIRLDGETKIYELISEEFVDRLQEELLKVLGKTVEDLHVETMLFACDSLYRIRADYAGIRKFFAEHGSGVVTKR